MKNISLNFRDYLAICFRLWYNKIAQKKEGDVSMAASYKKLWKLLIDKDMKKEDLRKAAGITTTAMAKLGRNEDVRTSVLLKICNVLECDISDIMEIVED